MTSSLKGEVQCNCLSDILTEGGSNCLSDIPTEGGSNCLSDILTEGGSNCVSDILAEGGKYNVWWPSPITLYIAVDFHIFVKLEM